jgi:DUF1680 family protein
MIAFISRCLLPLVATSCVAWSAESTLVMLDAPRVRLLDSPFKQRQELHRTGYLGTLEVERLLFPYRAAAGLAQSAGVTGGYGGWDGGFIRGHMAGHYLSAASRMFAATGDSSFRDKANAVVDGLAACQEKLGTGHLAAFPEEVLADFESKGKGSHGIVVPYYTIHKVMAGLIDAHHYLGNTKALAMAERMADCYAKRMAALTPEQIEKLLRTDQQRNPLTEFGGMSDALTALAQDSRHDRHLQLARVFIRDWLTKPLAAGEDRLANLHANTHVAQAVGIAHYANITGDHPASAASENFWNLITRTRSFVIGGNSFKEWLDKADIEAGPSMDEGKVLPYNTAETCNTHNMLKLTRWLIQRASHNGKRAHYGDFFERALYNHILSSVDPISGRVTYFHPLHGDFKTYLKGCECCDGSGIENTARYGEGIYFRGDKSLFINLYIPSIVDWREAGLVIRQEGNIPWQDTATFTIARAEQPVAATLNLRMPHWLSGKAVFEMAGKTREIDTKSVFSVTETWKTGDRFTVKFPAALRMERAKDAPEMVSLTYGPLVLAARLGKQGMPDDINDKDIAKSIPRPAVPAIVGASEDPAQWLHQMDTNPLTFEARECGPAAGLKFQPVHDIHHERFAVYLPFLTKEQSASRSSDATPAKDQPKDPTLVDQIMPGRDDSEKNHDPAGEHSITGTGPQGKTWRDAAADGWFSYTLPNATATGLSLVCTFWGDDRDRVFEIQVNGIKIATQSLDGSKPGTYFDVSFPIPAEALSGQQNVNVRFQGTGNGRVGGVFGLRLHRAN